MKLPRFTLRDLFWLVLVAAMGCAWWVERQATTERERQSRVAWSMLWRWSFDPKPSFPGDR